MKSRIPKLLANSIIILLVSLLFYSCKSDAKKYVDIYTNGYIRKTEYLNDAKIKCIGYKKDGFLDSCEIQYDEKGQIRNITNYRNGVTLGDALEFYDNESLKTYQFMSRQDTCCIQQEYNKAGNIKSSIDSMGWYYFLGDFDKIKDSAFLRIIIPKVLFNDINLYASNNGINYRKIELKGSKEFINDYEGTYIQVARNDFHTYLKAKVRIQNSSKILIDSLNYIRNRN